MPRPNYRRTIEWIALNDEPTLTGLDEVADMISVQLVADMWGYDAMRVARDVINFRRRNGA